MSQVVRAKAEERTVTAGLWKKYSVKKKGGRNEGAY